MAVVPYYPLSDEVMKKIIELKLGKIARRVRENHEAEFSYAPELVEHIAQRCTEVDTGARNVDHILTRTLLPEMSAEFLARMAEDRPIGAVQVSVTATGSSSTISRDRDGRHRLSGARQLQAAAVGRMLQAPVWHPRR